MSDDTISGSRQSYEQIGCGCLGSMLVNFVLGWLVYGGFKAGIITALISWVLELVSLVAGAIPIAGPLGYWYAAKNWIMPLFPQNGLPYTWLTGLYLWGGLAGSICTNLWIVAMLIMGLVYWITNLLGLTTKANDSDQGAESD